jgi:NAD(P)H-flavin reductase
MFPVTLSITRVNKHTPTVWSFFMTPQRGPRPGFKAGQVAILEANDCGDSHVAFASAPEEDEFEFLIKRNPASPKVTGVIFEPQRDNKIVLKNIVGRSFSVEEHRGADLVFVAMGTGLAPLRSALRHLLRSRNEYGRIVTLYGARTVKDICFADEMATEWREQGVEAQLVISQPDCDWAGPTGRAQSLLDHIAPEPKKTVALICGSQEMIEQTRLRLLNLGFAPEKILTNY